MSMQNVKMSVWAAAIVIGLSAALFAPVQATSEDNAVAVAAAGEVGYLPALVANQATEVQPSPATF